MDNDNIDISHNNKKSEISSIKNMVRNLEMKLQGYIWTANGDEMVYVGDALCRSIIIKSATTLLQSFCESANLITSKKDLTLIKQKWEINTTFNRVLARNIGEQVDNYDVIMKSFKSTLQNIFDIIISSKEVMLKFHGNEVEEETKTPAFG